MINITSLPIVAVTLVTLASVLSATAIAVTPPDRRARQLRKRVIKALLLMAVAGVWSLLDLLSGPRIE